MHFALFLISAFILGALAAVPAGPVQIEVVRRSINGHLLPSLAVVFGAFIIDVAYGMIALFGVAPFIGEKKVIAEFWLLGGLILAVIGITVIRRALSQEENVQADSRIRRKRWGIIGGLSLSATNPVMVIWWLSAARIFSDIGLIRELTSHAVFWFVIAGSLGLAAYLTVLSLFIYWAKKFISPQRLRAINIGFGIFLLLIAVYFIVSSVIYLVQAA